MQWFELEGEMPNGKSFRALKRATSMVAAIEAFERNYLHRGWHVMQATEIEAVLEQARKITKAALADNQYKAEMGEPTKLIVVEPLTPKQEALWLSNGSMMPSS